MLFRHKQLLLGALCLNDFVAARVKWKVTSRLTIYGTVEETCPEFEPTVGDGAYRQIYSDGLIRGGGSETPPDAATSFLITKGPYIDSSSPRNVKTLTNLKVAVKGGCWQVDQGQSDAVISVGECDGSEKQLFWVDASLSTDAANSSTIATNGLGSIVLPFAGQGLLQLKAQESDARFCFYEASSGDLVVFKGRVEKDFEVDIGGPGPSPVPKSSKPTNTERPKLPARSQPPTVQPAKLPAFNVPSSATFVPKVDLPGCIDEVGWPKFETMNCVVATAYNGAPAGCDTDLTQTDCILNYIPAFCGDLIESRAAAGDDVADNVTAMGVCIKAVYKGPCIANPTGAACASGLFEALPEEPSTPIKRSVGFNRRQAAETPEGSMFPKEVWDEVAESFVFNSATILFVNVSRTVMVLAQESVENSNILCLGLAGALNNTFLAEKCPKIFKVHQAEPPTAEYYATMEKAGEIFTEVIGLLVPVSDPVRAANLMGPETWAKLAAKFTAEEAPGGGFALKATGVTATVTFSKLTDQAAVVAFADEAEGAATLKTAQSTGFRGCNKITGDDGALEVACSAYGVSGPEVAQEPEPKTPKEDPVFPTPTKITPNPSLTPEETITLDELNKEFSDWLTTGVDVQEPFANPDFEAYNTRIRDAMTRSQEKAIVDDFATQYAITAEDRTPVEEWAKSYRIDPAGLRAAVDKIPNYEGTVIRHTEKSADEMDMLCNFRAGPRTPEDLGPGVYNIRDMVVNKSSRDPVTGEPLRDLMATTTGFVKFANYEMGPKFYVIKSRFGKWINALARPDHWATENEVIFLDSAQGKFKLLGWGEDANAVPFVFYFENIE